MDEFKPGPLHIKAQVMKRTRIKFLYINLYKEKKHKYIFKTQNYILENLKMKSKN